MRRTLVQLVPIFVALSLGRTAFADSEADEKAAARLLGTEGVRLALSGDCVNAVDKLTRAEALVHAPTTAVPLARCDIQLGKLVAGTELLNRVVHETLPPNAPRSWVDAKKAAEELLDTTGPRIAKLRIHLDGVPSGAPNVKVAVDGEPVPGVLLDNDRPTDPGPHHITAEADGFTPASSDLTLADAQSQTVSLRLEPQPGANAATATTLSAPPPPAAQVAPSDAVSPPARNHLPAYIALSIGAAGLATGTIFGILALSAKSHLDSECNAGKLCPAGAQSDIDSLHLDALVSTIGLGVGVAGVALGTYLWATSHDETPQKTSAFVVRPWVGAAAAGVAGSFQ
jgi:hypothetical protein